MTPKCYSLQREGIKQQDAFSRSKRRTSETIPSLLGTSQQRYPRMTQQHNTVLHQTPRVQRVPVALRQYPDGHALHVPTVIIFTVHFTTYVPEIPVACRDGEEWDAGKTRLLWLVSSRGLFLEPHTRHA